MELRRWGSNFLDEILSAERDCEDERLQIPPPCLWRRLWRALAMRLDHDNPVAAMRKACRRIFVFGFSGTLLPRRSGQSKIQAKILPKLHPVLVANLKARPKWLLEEASRSLRMAPSPMF